MIAELNGKTIKSIRELVAYNIEERTFYNDTFLGIETTDGEKYVVLASSTGWEEHILNETKTIIKIEKYQKSLKIQYSSGYLDGEFQMYELDKKTLF